MRSLDDPAMPPESVVSFNTTSGNAGCDCPLLQCLPASQVVVALVRVNFLRTLSRAPAFAGNWWYSIKHGFQLLRVVSVGARYDHRQRNTLTVYRDMPFAPKLATVSRIWPGLLAPRELATLALSMLTRLQSIASYPRNRDNISVCNRTHTPLSCHSRKRRQQVIPRPNPISCGKYSHGMPVSNTNKMPFNAALSSTRGRPPLGEWRRFGSNGSSVSHNASSIRLRVIRLQTYTPRLRMTRFC